MSTEPNRLTDDERRKLTHIPDNVETRDVLENLLFDLSLKGILTDDNLHLIIHNRYDSHDDDLESEEVFVLPKTILPTRSQCRQP